MYHVDVCSFHYISAKSASSHYRATHSLFHTMILCWRKQASNNLMCNALSKCSFHVDTFLWNIVTSEVCWMMVRMETGGCNFLLKEDWKWTTICRQKLLIGISGGIEKVSRFEKSSAVSLEIQAVLIFCKFRLSQRGVQTMDCTKKPVFGKLFYIKDHLHM